MLVGPALDTWLSRRLDGVGVVVAGSWQLLKLFPPFFPFPLEMNRVGTEGHGLEMVPWILNRAGCCAWGDGTNDSNDMCTAGNEYTLHYIHMIIHRDAEFLRTFGIWCSVWRAWDYVCVCGGNLVTMLFQCSLTKNVDSVTPMLGCTQPPKHDT